jgi:hypothetical protein
MESDLTAMEGQHHKKVRFSSDTLNDLLFWGAHLMVVAISLAIIWSKLDSTTRALLKIVDAQNQELSVTQEQAVSAKRQAEQAEITRAIAAEEARQTKETLRSVLIQQGEFRKLALENFAETSSRFDAIQTNVLATLDQIKSLQSRLAGTAKTSQIKAVTAEAIADSATVKARNLGGALAVKRRQLRRVGKKLTTLKDRNLVQRVFNVQ